MAGVRSRSALLPLLAVLLAMAASAMLAITLARAGGGKSFELDARDPAAQNLKHLETRINAMKQKMAAIEQTIDSIPSQTMELKSQQQHAESQREHDALKEASVQSEIEATKNSLTKVQHMVQRASEKLVRARAEVSVDSSKVKAAEAKVKQSVDAKAKLESRMKVLQAKLKKINLANSKKRVDLSADRKALDAALAQEQAEKYKLSNEQDTAVAKSNQKRTVDRYAEESKLGAAFEQEEKAQKNAQAAHEDAKTNKAYLSAKAKVKAIQSLIAKLYMPDAMIAHAKKLASSIDPAAQKALKKDKLQVSQASNTIDADLKMLHQLDGQKSTVESKMQKIDELEGSADQSVEKSRQNVGTLKLDLQNQEDLQNDASRSVSGKPKTIAHLKAKLESLKSRLSKIRADEGRQNKNRLAVSKQLEELHSKATLLNQKHSHELEKAIRMEDQEKSDQRLLGIRQARA